MGDGIRHLSVAHPAVNRVAWRPELETADPAAVARMERPLLADQLARTAATSDFYRARWAAAGVDPRSIQGPEDLPRLPFTEKHDLQAAQAARAPFGTNQAAPPEALVRMQATGGTTGKPLRMAMTRSDIAAYNEVGARAAWAAGLRPGDILFECMNYALYAGGVNDHGTFETLGACVAPVGVGQSRRLLEILSDLGTPAALYSTPSYALHLASVAREEGREPRDLGLRRGLFSGDAGLADPAYRAEIQDAWGMIARSIYGTSETAPVAAECDVADGLHWMGQGAFLAEFVNPDTGDIVTPADGATAELVITTIRREAHPLIRFRTHDHVRIVTDRCACGRTSGRFHVLGRSDDMFIVRGVNVFPLAVAAIVNEFRPRLGGEFRIVLSEPPPLVTPPRVLVEVPADTDVHSSRAVADALAARLRDVLVFSADVEPVPPGTFPRSELKTRRVLRAWLGEA
jgi:phenylacetate-CoA ligase